jgi:hypothetical protein
MWISPSLRERVSVRAELQLDVQRRAALTPALSQRERRRRAAPPLDRSKNGT